MKTRRSLLGIVCILSFVLFGCNLVPQAVRNIFVTSTPTSTVTPTSTATSTSTPTATATPLPPLMMQGCPFLNSCPGVEDIESYSSDSIPVGETVDIQIQYDRPVRINVGWSAADQQHLEDNIPHIAFYFRIDGKSYDTTSFVDSGFWYSTPTSETDLLEYSMGVVLSGWKIGETHKIEYGYVTDTTLNDGWSEWGPLNMDYTIIVEPVIGPPPTLTPTITLTPKPIIYTPRPTTIPPTKTQSCSAEATIQISNTTGGIVTLELKGPGYYYKKLDTGDTTLNVCSGQYSYIAYGCGGARDTGTISSGESHEFYCTSG
ncbi:MAG: hypothetical protein AB9897_06035 [Anaerolineaceae bacterium]